MTLAKLASAIAKREGKRSQARIGDIREVLKLICVLEAEDCIACDVDTQRDSTATSPLNALTEGANAQLDKLRKRKPGRAR